MQENYALIFAGGRGERMNSRSIPKQFLELHGKPIIIYTLEKFENHPDITGIVVVILDGWQDYLERLLEKFAIRKVISIVPGGSTGQASIHNGLESLSKFASPDATVLIHDGVRPLITSKLLSENIEAVKKYGNCITSGLVQETIVEISDDNDVLLVPDRKHSRVAKAPQSFFLEDVLAAHRKALSEGITDFIDTCTMMQHYGYRLHMIDGPHENIKITTPEDYYIMQGILQARENAQIYGLDE